MHVAPAERGATVSIKQSRFRRAAGLSLSCADFEEYYGRRAGQQISPNNIFGSLAPLVTEQSGIVRTPQMIRVEGGSPSDGNKAPGPGLWLLPGHRQVQKYDNKVTVAYGSMGSLEARCLEGFTDLCRKMETE